MLETSQHLRASSKQWFEVCESVLVFQVLYTDCRGFLKGRYKFLRWWKVGSNPAAERLVCADWFFCRIQQIWIDLACFNLFPKCRQKDKWQTLWRLDIIGTLLSSSWFSRMQHVIVCLSVFRNPLCVGIVGRSHPPPGQGWATKT